MHELSLALSLVDTASEEIARRGATRVTAIYLKVGLFAGIAKEALTFSYSLACEGTPLEGSELVIEDAPIIGFCSTCLAEVAVASIQDLRCSRCGRLGPEIIAGKELEVSAMEIE